MHLNDFYKTSLGITFLNIEKKFICKSLPVGLIGMNQNLMSTYIEYVADQLCKELQIPLIYKAKNPFIFMDMISLSGKTNFFEKRVGEYARANIMSKHDHKEKDLTTFDINLDF